MDTSNLDDLELELRKLPGVRAAGFTDRDDLLHVQVQVAGDHPSPALPQQAARIAHRYADKPVAVEIVRWRTIEVPAVSDTSATARVVAVAPDAAPNVAAARTAADDEELGGNVGLGDRSSTESPRPRIRLLAVLTFPDTDELEVHLTYSGRRIIGRALASEGAAGAVNATLIGLRSFVPEMHAALAWAEELSEHGAEATVVVACAIDVDGGQRRGIASGSSRIEAAARATLHALNRFIEPDGDSAA